jgi:hypothetical protein
MFIYNWFAEEKQGHPIYVIRFELGENQFGNTVGIYLNEVACAIQARSHVVVVPLNYNRDFHDEISKGAGFMQSLCTVYVHPNPAPSIRESIALYLTRCTCRKSCWEPPSPPWMKNVPTIRDILQRALSAEVFDPQIRNGGDYFMGTRKVEVSENTTVIVTHKKVSHSNSSSKPVLTPHLHVLEADHLLPLVPTVAIQFRCSDNFKSMGMTPLAAIFDRLDGLGLGHHGSIYLMTEHPRRLMNGARDMSRKTAVENRQLLCHSMINFMQND